MVFKPISKTVVTEISSFIVDSVSKVGLYKQTVSSKIKTESQLNKIDFNVSKTLSHRIENPSSIIGISTPEPVKVSLISTGSPIEPVDPEEPVVHHTAQLFVPNTLVAGNMLPITIIDPDIADGVVSIGVVLYNETTGETESIPLIRRIDKSFSGNAHTLNSKTPGVNFDSVMYCLLDQRLRVIYSDPLTANHNRGNVVSYVNVLSPSSTAIVNSRSVVSIGKPIPIEILDRDLNVDSVNVDLINITKATVMPVVAHKTVSGRFTASVRTDIYSEDGLHPMDDMEVMYASIGDQLQVVYTDNLDINGEVSIITANVEIVAHTTTVSTLIVTSEIVLGDDLEFEVHDYAHVGEQITVTLSNVLSDEYEIIFLEETVVGTGIFVGSIATSLSYEVDNNVTTVKPGEFLKVVYVDNNNNVFTTLTKNIRTVAPPIIELPEEPETPDTEIPDEETEPVITGTVELLVNGSFFLNGSFKGSVLVEGLNDTSTRCSLIAS